MSCQGKKHNSRCGNTVYKCNKCGTVGCSNNGCTNQNFDNGRCMKCGGTDKSSV